MSEDLKEDYKNEEAYQDAFYYVTPLGFDAARRVWGTTTYDQVTEEETESAYVYKMDKPWLTREEVVVEIRWGRVLWVLGQGDKAVKVKLPRSDRVKVSATTASMSSDGVLTVVHGSQARTASEVVQ